MEDSLISVLLESFGSYDDLLTWANVHSMMDHPMIANQLAILYWRENLLDLSSNNMDEVIQGAQALNEVSLFVFVYCIHDDERGLLC